MYPSSCHHLCSIWRYSSNTGQLHNMSMLLDVIVHTNGIGNIDYAQSQCWLPFRVTSVRGFYGRLVIGFGHQWILWELLGNAESQCRPMGGHLLPIYNVYMVGLLADVATWHKGHFDWIFLITSSPPPFLLVPSMISCVSKSVLSSSVLPPCPAL